MTDLFDNRDSCYSETDVITMPPLGSIVTGTVSLSFTLTREFDLSLGTAFKVIERKAHMEVTEKETEKGIQVKVDNFDEINNLK